MNKSQIARSVAAALVTTAMGLAVAQTVQSELHRDAATRNVGGDPFMTKYARAFYCNLPDDNNQIVINSRGWNNTTGTGANAQYRIPLTQIFDDVWFIGNRTFQATLDFGGRSVESITLDPDGRFPDKDPSDNIWPKK